MITITFARRFEPLFERSEHDFSLLRRAATLALALTLLIAQTCATAHFHQKDFRDNITQGVQGNDGLCSLCLFHFHAPAQAAAPTNGAVPTIVEWRLLRAAGVRPRSPSFALAFSRGPPTLP